MVLASLKCHKIAMVSRNSKESQMTQINALFRLIHVCVSSLCLCNLFVCMYLVWEYLLSFNFQWGTLSTLYLGSWL